MYVINYDHPKTSEDYIHRIGRTGRCDKTGTSYTLFTPENAKQAKDLISVLEEAGQEVSQELNDLVENEQFSISNKKGKGNIFSLFIFKAFNYPPLILWLDIGYTDADDEKIRKNSGQATAVPYQQSVFLLSGGWSWTGWP